MASQFESRPENIASKSRLGAAVEAKVPAQGTGEGTGKT
jgi:hypothetical protein